ncbi:MAG: hypothetical protein SchgKO_13760 [Schleiferiaceae bacterium]
MAKDKLTPSTLVSKIRENQNNNKTLKSLFASQFLGKFTLEELDALKLSIDKEIEARKDIEIHKRIDYLESLGYEVTKK